MGPWGNMSLSESPRLPVLCLLLAGLTRSSPAEAAAFGSPSLSLLLLMAPSVAPAAGKGVMVGREMSAAVQGNRDVRDDTGEPGCSLDLLTHCHRHVPLQ